MGKTDEPPAYDAKTNSQPQSSAKSGADRPLPDGWVKQWDSNYNQYFYVNTRETPPRSTWIHPEDEGNKYAAPSGAPPGQHGSGENRNYGGAPQQPYPQQMPPPMQSYQQQPMMMQQPMMQQPMMQQPMMGGGGGGLFNRFGGGGLGGGLGGGRMGGGMGGMGAGLLGGGAGMLGGMALMNGMDHMEHDAYQDGYMQGQMNDDMGGGGDMGGGDMGGDMGGGDF